MHWANGTAFGLGSSVFSAWRGPAIAARLPAAGMTINSVLTFVGLSSIPFGGVGESGFGRFHGDEGLRKLSHAKVHHADEVGLGKGPAVVPRTPDQCDAIRKTLRPAGAACGLSQCPVTGPVYSQVPGGAAGRRAC